MHNKIAHCIIQPNRIIFSLQHLKPRSDDDSNHGPPWSYWPDDFIPQYNTMKPTDVDPTPVDDRFKLMDKALDKRPGPNQGTPGISRENFVIRLQNLRMAAIKFGAVLAEKFLVEAVNRAFPGLKVASRDIQCSADLVEYYKRGPNDNKMRAIIHFCTDLCWGDNNQWAINGESEFCQRFRIKFTGTKSNGKTSVKVHKGRCLAQIFVARKGTICEKIRNTGKKFHFEAIYRRGEKSKIGLSGCDSKGIPRLLKQIKATVATHGFNGKLGICDGHPEADKIKKEKQPSVVETPNSQDSQVSTLTMMSTPVPSKRTDFQEWCSNNFHKYETREDALGALLLEQTDIGSPGSVTMTAEENCTVVTRDTFVSTTPPNPVVDTTVTNTNPVNVENGIIVTRDTSVSTITPPNPVVDTTTVTNTNPVNVQKGITAPVSKSMLYVFFDLVLF